LNRRGRRERRGETRALSLSFFALTAISAVYVYGRKVAAMTKSTATVEADFIFDEFEDRNSPLNRATSAVIGAAIEVHRHLGAGFLESSYENALAHEMELRGIQFRRQVPVAVMYKGKAVGESRLDFLVEGILVVEIKAVDAFAPIHSAQLISYLKATGYKLGLLINFTVRVLKDGIKRIALR
jgi:GxxExxY protein